MLVNFSRDAHCTSYCAFNQQSCLCKGRRYSVSDFFSQKQSKKSITVPRCVCCARLMSSLGQTCAMLQKCACCARLMSSHLDTCWNSVLSCQTVTLHTLRAWEMQNACVEVYNGCGVLPAPYCGSCAYWDWHLSTCVTAPGCGRYYGCPQYASIIAALNSPYEH